MFLSVSYTKKTGARQLFDIQNSRCVLLWGWSKCVSLPEYKIHNKQNTLYSDASHFQNSQKVDRIQIGFVSEIGSGRSLFRVVFSGFMFIFDQSLFFF